MRRNPVRSREKLAQIRRASGASPKFQRGIVADVAWACRGGQAPGGPSIERGYRGSSITSACSAVTDKLSRPSRGKHRNIRS